MKMLINTMHGQYEVVSLHVNESGETYVIVNSDNVAKLSDGENVGEHTIKLNDYILFDYFLLGDETAYINQLDFVIFDEREVT